MKFTFEGPDWGDTLYYIDIDAKNKKIDIKKGSLVGIMLSFSERAFKLRNEEEDKEINITSEWCSEDLANLENIAQSVLESINRNNVWSCFEED